jgi:hypothetical protein
MNSGSTAVPPKDLAHDLVLPTLLFSGLGAMTWAVRGCAGAGGMNAHIAPGLIWGTAWWFLSREDRAVPERRYSSGWILLALAAGFAIAGERGWMQWPNFFDGHLATNYGKGEFVPISRAYGFLWFFLAGTAWAALPACVLAWTGSGRPTHAWQWTLRLACGFGGGYLAWRLFAAFPSVFLPLYDSVQAKYLDFHTNPNLAKLYRDNGATMRHMGFCLGFLLFEIGRKDWQNVKLILSVGLPTGIGWAACQNWHWAGKLWPDATFNFGRCWEASAGICIGIGLGLAYYLANRRQSPGQEGMDFPTRCAGTNHNSEWLVATLLLSLLGLIMLLPEPRDLRERTNISAANPDYFSAMIFLGAGVLLGVAKLRERFTGRTSNLIWRELGLMLVLSWFIKTQMASTYGDGVADKALTGIFGPGSFYFALVVLYAGARLLGQRKKFAGSGVSPMSPNSKSEENPCNALESVAIYLGLTIIAFWCLRVGLVNSWHAPVFFGIVVAVFGIAYRWLGGLAGSAARTLPASQPGYSEDPNIERWGLFLGLVYGFGLSLRKALKGGANLYVGNEDAWDNILWNQVSLGMLACLVIGMLWILSRCKSQGVQGSLLANAYGILWLVLLAQNLLAQIVTGPLFGPRASWNEFAFSLLYVVLFVLTAVIVIHYRWYFRLTTARQLSPSILKTGATLSLRRTRGVLDKRCGPE